MAPYLCAVPRTNRLGHSPGAALTQPLVSAPPLRGLPTLQSSAISKEEAYSSKTVLTHLCFTLISNEEISLKSKGPD